MNLPALPPEIDERREAARILLARRRARSNLLDFMRHVWWMPEPFTIGRHTRKICERLDKAVADYLEGRSTFLNIGVPFRHGKSDIVSRAFPAYFLGRLADHEPSIILTGYGAKLVEGFGSDAKRIINGDAYRELFPAVHLSSDTNNAAEWMIEGSTGRVTCAGLDGAINGKGGALIVVDDYCKKRHEAESKTYRDGTWNSFANEVMTRRAPVCIVIVVATPWHTDDIRGRIKAKMVDPNFPQFEFVDFPATNPDGTFLFPERMTDQWYREQYATLSKYEASGLLDINPEVRGGNVFKIDGIQEVELSAFPAGRYVRTWDLASSEVERVSDDPDWTAGPLGMIRTVQDRSGFRVKQLWIRDIVLLREEAPKRDARIVSTAESDPHGTPVAMEAFGAYKDAYAHVKQILQGRAIVTALRPPGDKMAKAQPMEVMFESCNVFVPSGAPWLPAFRRWFASFPKGKRDIVDAVALIWWFQSAAPGGLLL